MGFDLFGSFAEATCAALFLVASQLITSWTALMYPVLISSLGIVVGVVTPILRKFIYPLHEDFGAVGTISIVLMSPVVVVLSWMALPDEFTMSATITEVRWWCCALAILLGLWSGLLIGFVTESYTSDTCVPVWEIAEMLSTLLSCLAHLAENGMPVVRMSLKEPVLASCASAETSDPFVHDSAGTTRAALVMSCGVSLFVAQTGPRLRDSPSVESHLHSTCIGV